MESASFLIGACLLAVGLIGGWYCYARVSADAVDEATYQVAHGILPDNSLWLGGAIIGLLTMVSGMVLLFVGLVGVQKIQTVVTWFQTVFG